MKRRYERLWAQMAAQGRRLKAQLKQVLSTALAGQDIDDAAEHRAAQVAEAEAIAGSAAGLRAGVAKAAQLRAYVQGSVELSAEAQAVLGRLWDHLPGEEPQAIFRVLRDELGTDIESLFASFEPQPIAAASLGQVHAARLLDGQEVAVKVQYAGVAEALRDDLKADALLRQLAGADLGDALSEEAAAALRERLLAELDYRTEAESLRRFKRAFLGDPRIAIPAVIANLSTIRVLTMERLSGRSLPEFAASGSKEERAAVAAIILRFAFLSPWRHRIVNLDPNPGNYLIQPSCVGFVDFGCTAEVPEELALADRQIFLSMMHRDGEKLRYAAHRAGLIPHAISFNSSTYRRWEQTLAAPFLSQDVTLLEPAWARELTDLTWRLAQTGKITLPPATLLLWRQRLGVLAVVAGLRPELPMRRLLSDLLDDGEHPVPLYERYP